MLTLPQKLAVFAWNWANYDAWEPAVGDLYTPADEGLALYRIIGSSPTKFSTMPEGSNDPDQNGYWLRHDFKAPSFGPKRLKVPPDLLQHDPPPPKSDVEFVERVAGAGNPARNGEYGRVLVDGRPIVTSMLQLTLLARDIGKAFPDD